MLAHAVEVITCNGLLIQGICKTARKSPGIQ